MRFEISDTGIGIEPKDMERLFAPFTQAEPGTSRRFGGTGLGLSISRHLVKMMGGEMGVESKPGKGSLFWFVIPWEQAPADTTWAQKTLSAIAGQRVFCAEQNAGSPRGISSMLDRWGMDCDDALEGPEALELIRKALKEDRPFKLAVIDLQLRVMDGLTLAGIIREDQDLRDLRLVALCPLYSSEVNRDRLKDLFDEVLTKPIRRDNLRRCLVKLLSPAKNSRKVKASRLRRDKRTNSSPGRASFWRRTIWSTSSWPPGSWPKWGTRSVWQTTAGKPWRNWPAGTTIWCLWTARCRKWTGSRPPPRSEK